MKKTLYESLIDYDQSMLQAIAGLRGAVMTSNHRLTAIQELADQLVTPTSVAITLDDLSEAETSALNVLQSEGGWMEARRFSRRFGTVRPMGPRRLVRERPWQDPENAAEGLWYRGLIFKGFQQTASGVIEVVYIPADLLNQLPPPSPGHTSPSLRPIPEPDHVQQTTDNLVEDVFGILVYCRNHEVRLSAGGAFNRRDSEGIGSLQTQHKTQDKPSQSARLTPGAQSRLFFVLHISRAAGLISEDDRRLHVDPGPAKAWLNVSSKQRLAGLQAAWRDNPEWNELQHVPSIRLRETGWKNDPLLARQAVLRALARCTPFTWYALKDLIGDIKDNDPDFQRPDGDYTTWYIEDLQGEPLMGFERWDDVEGALIRYLVSKPLFWLGVVDLGYEREQERVLAFRIAETGLQMLDMIDPASPQPPPSDEAAVDRTLVVGDDFYVRLTKEADLYDRFQLARFAEFVDRDVDWVSYRITPNSVASARQQGVTPQQMTAFLKRTSGGVVSSDVLEAIQRWETASTQVWLEQVIVLRVATPDVLQHLQKDAEIGPLLRDVVDTHRVLVDKTNVRQVRSWLARHGYL